MKPVEIIMVTFVLIMVGVASMVVAVGYINNKIASPEMNINMTHNYLLEMDFISELHHETSVGVGSTIIDKIVAGTYHQDRHIHSLYVWLDVPPSGNKWVNVTIGDGTNTIMVPLQGANQSGYSETSEFDWDVSAENLTITYAQSAGGATDDVNIKYEWHYKENE